MIVTFSELYSAYIGAGIDFLGYIIREHYILVRKGVVLLKMQRNLSRLMLRIMVILNMLIVIV